MRLAISVLGCEVLRLETGPATVEGAADSTSYPVGFAASAGDQRWDKGAEFE